MLEYQRVWAEISLDNIAKNVLELRKALGDGEEIMAIIKADGYGHGAEEAAKVMLFNGAKSLGVAICDEGVSLRQANFHVPILVLGYTPKQKLDEVVLNDLIQTIFRFDMAKHLSDCAVRLGKMAEVHVKIDTGMGRIGYFASDCDISEIEQIVKLPNIKATGIYTHFADADKTNSTFVYEQYNKFCYVIEQLKNRGITFETIHAANSGAALGHREIKANAVRAGISLYGLKPSEEMGFAGLDFAPAMSLKTRISYVKTLEDGVSVGYGRTYYTKGETVVATIPVGYADGYMRALSNKGRVLVRGKYAPIIGNICMDQFMVNVTGIDGVSADDEVVLIGEQGGNVITAEELANLVGTINYEIATNIGKRVPRVYIKNGETIKTLNFYSGC